MSRSRPLAEMLAEVLAAGGRAPGTGDGVRVTRLDLDLPVDLALGPDAGDGPVLLGELPRWRWRTDFDAPAARLTLHCGEVLA